MNSKIKKYFLKFKKQECPYCGEKTVGFSERTKMASIWYEITCEKCGAVLKFKKFVFPALGNLMVAFAVYLNARYFEYKVLVAALMIAIFLIYVFVIIPLMPIKYESDYKHPEKEEKADQESN